MLEKTRVYQRTPKGSHQPTCIDQLAIQIGSMSVEQEDVKAFNEKESSQTAG
jgi:hypothetical protein